MKAEEWSQHFSHYKSTGFFHRYSRAAYSVVQGLILAIFKLSEMFWLSSLPAKIKKNRSKMKELELSHKFRHYNPIESICCHGNQSFNPIWSKTL